MSADQQRVEQVEHEIRGILKVHGRVPTEIDALSPGDDLFALGMSSHASISVMLVLEEHFDIEFPDRMLNRRYFESIAAMRDAVIELKDQVSA